MIILATTHATTQHAVSEALAFTAVVLLALFIYMLPSIVAKRRRHRQVKAILVVNIFLGWSFLGWVLSLAWAFTADVVEDDEIRITKGRREPRIEPRASDY
jgi:hypothetical protein